MRIPIPDHIRSAVINSWMSGKSRDEIASEVNISTGSVSSIKEQWQNKIGAFEANNLRELGLALKKAGISPVQCANGLRIYNILNQLGIDEDHLFDFLNKLYNETKEQKLSPTDLARLVKVINDFPGINSLNKLPNKIKKREQEKINLDADIHYKKLEIQKLDQEKEKKRKEIHGLQEELESFRKEMREEKKDFMLFKDAKAELKKHGISIQILEPLIDVIKIFDDMHFSPLTILSEFSDINEYRDLVKNKNRELKELESLIQNLKHILDIYEKKIASNRIIVQSLNKLENLGFNASDIKTLEMVFTEISERYGLNKEEIKILFFRYINCFNTLLSLQQDILEKTDKISILDSQISSRRKVIESQPIIFSILQNLVSTGLNEHDIQMAFSIFKTDLCNNMPYGDRTYIEHLSKDLNKYRTVRDTLHGLNTKILVKKISIDKLASVKSKLETFLFSLAINIYFYYSILLNAQVQIQKNLRIILLISNFNYLPLLCIVTKPKNFVRSKFKIEQNNNKKKGERKKKQKTAKTKRKMINNR